MKKGAIFDMDGLLFDTEQVYCKSWIETAKRFGQVPHPDFQPAMCGTSGEGSLAVIRRCYPEVDAEAFLREGIACTAEKLRASVPEKPGARELIRFFQANGVRMAVASSSNREMILGNLRQTGLEAYFDAVISGDDVQRGKPEPDIFLLAARRLECAPEECYVLEDGLNGARAGIAAGCATVMVPDLFEPTEDLRAGCAGIYPSLHAVREAVEAGVL